MRPAAAPHPIRPRLLRGVAVGAVLVGYLGVLMGTSMGQGWGLLAHLATETHATLEAPRLQSSVDVAPVPGISTLRAPAHAHGDRTHRHGSARPEAGRTVRTSGSLHPAPEAGGLHAHDGALHSHDLPPPSEAPAVVLALDHHRLPAPIHLAAPPPAGTARLGSAPDRLASAERTVETPPPRAAG